MLLGLKSVSYRIGTMVLLDQVDFSLEEREKVALVGRNGAGKSTLFRILNNQIQPEDGLVIKRDGLRIASLQQAVPEGQDLTIAEVVAMGMGQAGAATLTFQKLSALDHSTLTEAEGKALDEAQHYLSEHHAWQVLSDIEQVMSRFKLPPELPFSSLSGGMKRKVMLAQAMVGNPDVLLLDEPTNHLDIPSIELLEEEIRQFQGAVILVSHDRAFMRRLATRVCDLDRGMLKSWSGGYDGFLKGKAEFLHAEEKQRALFDKKLAEEEVWIRRGIEARRTRNEGRVRALKDMRQQFAERRNLLGKAKVEVQEAERSGKLVAELTDVSLALDGFKILDHFSTLIMRGEKIGFLGPNGIGKTTALKVILGQLKPDSGDLRLGTKLEIAYFDQLRSAFNEEETAVDVIGAGREYIQKNGASQHVMGYLQDFLFTPDRARQPVRSLSGGERARLLLAQLFSKPSNLMVLDEPTNDLDIETLELLEERLMAYEGTVILVSHDREFINQIATRCMVFEGEGVVQDYIGGYEDWLRQRTEDPWSNLQAKLEKGMQRTGAQVVAQAEPATAPATPAAGYVEQAKTFGQSVESAAEPKGKKLGYKEARELEALPALIEKLETEQSELIALIGDPAFYQKPATEVTQVQNRMSKVESDLNQAYARWEELEAKKA